MAAKRTKFGSISMSTHITFSSLICIYIMSLKNSYVNQLKRLSILCMQISRRHYRTLISFNLLTHKSQYVANVVSIVMFRGSLNVKKTVFYTHLNSDSYIENSKMINGVIIYSRRVTVVIRFLRKR